MKISRAQFLQIVFGGSAWLAASPSLAQRVRVAVPDVARPLPLSAVRLTGGPLKHAQELDGNYLLSLEPARMLAFYRRRAGLEANAEPYSGWDGDGRNLTGHIAGHYLSAVSLMWAATGDTRFKQRADTIVSELKVVQEAHGDGFAGALSGVREAFAQVSAGNIRSASFDLNGLWSPWYTLHKTFAGLRDAYRHTGNQAALDVEVRFAQWAERVLAPMSDEQVQRMLNTEFGGMNEVFADLYADTGDRRWLALSLRFEHQAVLDPLKRREDPLDGLHGNTQVPKLLGSAARYVYAGDASDRVAAEVFWDRVVHHHTFASGGHGKDEYFREPDQLSHITDGRTAESCNVYNMLKLTRRLFAVRPDVQYAEFHERALFNHVLASIDSTDGAMCYMVPVGRGVRREYQEMERSFTCCVGSGMESHALHGDGLYYESGDRLYVNVYAPSTAQWEAAGISLEMETSFPSGDSATVKLSAQAPRAFTLALRRPSWAGDGFRVSVNGTAVASLPAPGSYVEIARTWKSGDSVALVLPKQVRLDRLGDDPTRTAIMWGPLVLAGDLGPVPPRREVRDAAADETVDQPRGEPLAPAIVTDRPVTEWLRPVASTPGRFQIVGAARGLAATPRDPQTIELAPLAQVHRRTYAGYWDLLTEAQYKSRVKEIATEEARQRALEQATISYVRAGDTNAEKAFNQQGEETSIARADGRPGRRGTKWFSFDVPVRTDGNRVTLVVTYNSDQRRPRRFDVLANGRRVGEQTIPQSSVSRFFDVTYALPADLVSSGQAVTVRFEAASGSEIATVFGIRVIRAS